MSNKNLTAKIANLESQVDHLETELGYINQLLIDFGFSEGIESLKGSLEEVLLLNNSL